MDRSVGMLLFAIALTLSSCTRKESAGDTKSPPPEASAPAQASGPHAVVNLKDGGKIPGTIVASSNTDVVVAGDNGVENKIPLTQVKSIDYTESPKPAPARQASQQSPAKPATSPAVPPTAPPAGPPQTGPGQAPPPARAEAPAETVPPPAPAPPPVTTKTYELPLASEISVRTNEAIDSGTATEGQVFDAQVTRDAKDADGATVIPRGSQARVIIRSASKGGHFRGQSDLALDLESVVIQDRIYMLDTVDITQKGKSGIGANKRTAEYTGGGAALGAIIGAIAGGGKGAAIGAGAGAGAGVLTQVLTKGGAIRVPAETVLTFRLDKPLKVTAVE